MDEIIKGSLSGIKVLDFSTLLPGPLASLFLAETGAEVIKIERPEVGDEIRTSYPKWGGQSASFSMLNRGKKSLALDLKDPDSFKILKPLIKKADIIIEQFRPGVMKRLGLDYETLSKINKKLMPLHDALFCETSPGPLKYAASLLGICSSDARLPIVQIEEDSKLKVKNALKQTGMI